MKKVKFLSTSAGSYGTAQSGEEKEVTDALAAELEAKGIVKVTGSAGKDPEGEQASKTSLRFDDQTGKTTAPAGETDTKNPTGPDKPAPKAAPLKSAPKKGKR